MRCSAIYFAFLAGVLLYPAFRTLDRPVVPRRRWLVIVAFPMLLDVAAAFLGIHESSLVTRSITGALFGFVLPFYCLPVALDAVGNRSLLHAFLPSVRKDP